MTDATLNTPQKQTSSEPLEQRIATLAAQIDAATCHLLELILEFDRSEAWAEQHALSCAHWLGWRLGWSRSMATERLRVAHALDVLPVLHKAFGHGELSYSKVRAVTRVARPDDEADWVEIAKAATAAELEKIVRRCRRATRSEELAQDQAQQQERYLHTEFDDDGMLVINGRLPPEAGAVVQRALETEYQALYRVYREQQTNREQPGEAPPTPQASERSTFSQLRADALEQLARRALCGGELEGGASHSQVVVHVDAETLACPDAAGRAELEDGPALGADAIRRLCCDTSLVAMVHDAQGKVLGAGRKTRVIGTALRRELNERDGCCQFPGCSHRYTDGHHIEHWANGGETVLSNLVEVCRSHHRLLHEGQYSVSLDEAGTATFFSPSGAPIPVVPKPASFRGNIAGAMAHWTQRAGLTIDAETNMPQGIGWDGTPPDYDWITTVMTQRIPAKTRGELGASP